MIRVNPRVVAATNRDLRAAVAAGTFREDLYYRTSAFVITVPPLRDRPEDIPALVHEFLRRSAERLKKDVQTITAEAMTSLVKYPWPGNVRELEHAVERAVILASGHKITARELSLEARDQLATTKAGGLDLKEQERETIRRALDHARGRRREAARALGISPVTLWRKMKRYHLLGD